MLLTLPGCGDPKPDPDDPTSEPPSSTTTEPVSDPPTSTTTPEPEPETAEDFIRRWHQAGDQMQVTGETAEYLALGLDCTPCSETAEIVAKYYAAGGFIQYGGTIVTRIRRVGRVDGAVEFEVDRTSAPTRYKETASGPIKKFAGGDDRIRMKITKTAGEWHVLDVGLFAT
ncbi:hypothetical protein [Nocardioides sp.]|uniref:hypothetical protein n=1 Tax=Nocardioides sp. TaxID=35761 RepID=UPI002723FA7A|nr:hypothetical protein [Nocardioides sp.]MDO9456597.1 hypothetical protein [Nocardioides sp.]